MSQTVQSVKELAEQLLNLVNSLPDIDGDEYESRLLELDDKVSTLDTAVDELVDNMEEVRQRVEGVESDMGETVSKEDFDAAIADLKKTYDAKLEELEQRIGLLGSAHPYGSRGSYGGPG